jgi:hypothetical protein
MVRLMRWDRLTLTALGGIAVFLIGAALLLADARPLFAPVIGMIGGIGALALANQARLIIRQLPRPSSTLPIVGRQLLRAALLLSVSALDVNCTRIANDRRTK